MAAAVQALRPEIEVTVSDPQALDAEVSRIDPQLVICSDLAEAIRSRLLAWIMLYPDGQNLVTYSIAGYERQLFGIDLPGLLSLVDDVVRYFRALPGSNALPDMTEGAIGG